MNNFEDIYNIIFPDIKILQMVYSLQHILFDISKVKQSIRMEANQWYFYCEKKNCDEVNCGENCNYYKF